MLHDIININSFNGIRLFVVLVEAIINEVCSKVQNHYFINALMHLLHYQKLHQMGVVRKLQ